MNKKTLVSMIATAVAAALMTVGILLEYLVIDFGKIAEKMDLPNFDFAGSVIGFFSGRDNAVTMSGSVLLRNLVNGSKDSLTDGLDKLFTSGAVIVGIPYIICLVILILAFVRKLWSYILTLVLCAAGEVLVIPGVFFFLPKVIHSGVHPFGVDVLPEKVVREVIWEGIGPAWWIMAAGFLLLVILTVIGITGLSAKPVQAGGSGGADSTPDRQAASYPVEGECGFICEFGPYNGVMIPLSGNAPVIIGSDASRAQLVLTEAGIEPIHCEIRWNQVLSAYEIRDFSESGVYVMGNKVGRGVSSGANHGDVLFLGDRNRRIYLV